MNEQLTPRNPFTNRPEQIFSLRHEIVTSKISLSGHVVKVLKINPIDAALHDFRCQACGKERADIAFYEETHDHIEKSVDIFCQECYDRRIPTLH